MRRAVRRGLLLLGLLAALVALRIGAGKLLGGWVLAREKARFAREVGPTETAGDEAERLPPAENAVRAIGRVVRQRPFAAAESSLLAAARCDDPASEAALRQLVAARAGWLAELRAAAALPRSSFGPLSELFHGGDRPPELTAWLRAARLLAEDGCLALADRDETRLRDDSAALHGITRTIRRVPVAFFGILGAAVEALELDLLRRSLASPRPAAFLDAAARQVAELRQLPGPAAVMTGEAVLGTAMLERDLAAPPTAGVPLRDRLEAAFWPWSEGHVAAGYLVGWRRIVERARIPQAEWDPEPPRSRWRALRRWVDPTVPYGTVNDLLLPNLLLGLRRMQLLATAEQLASLALAAARGEDPGTPHPSAATGTPPIVERTADGWRIALPAAEALARHEGNVPSPVRAADDRRAALMSWRVAAFAPAAAP